MDNASGMRLDQGQGHINHYRDSALQVQFPLLH